MLTPTAGTWKCTPCRHAGRGTFALRERITNRSDTSIVKRLELFAPENFPLVGPGDHIAGLVRESLRDENFAMKTGDVVVVAQKIISKSEDRVVDLGGVKPSDRAQELARQCDKDPRLVQLILDESTEVLRTAPGVIIIRHRLGQVMANAGIDHSNLEDSAGGERALLLPRDPDASARRLREELEQETGLELGVIVSDSFGRPWRLGTTGVCIGCDGIASLVDRCGDTDLFGQELMVTQVALGDELATAASLLMGQTDEARPLVVIRGANYAREPASASHLLRPLEEDLYR